MEPYIITLDQNPILLCKSKRKKLITLSGSVFFIFLISKKNLEREHIMT